MLGAASSSVAAPLKPSYCAPVAFRDYEIVIGHAALVRPAAGCNKPSLIRKVSTLTGRIGSPFEVPVPQTFNAFSRQWLFASRLEYSLDGLSWRPVLLR